MSITVKASTKEIKLLHTQLGEKANSEFYLRSDISMSGTVTVETQQVYRDLFTLQHKQPITSGSDPHDPTFETLTYTDQVIDGINHRTYTIPNTKYYVLFLSFDLRSTTAVQHKDLVNADIVVAMTDSKPLILDDGLDTPIANDTISIVGSVIRSLDTFGDMYTGRLFANDAILSANSLHLGNGVLSMDSKSNSLMFEPSGTQQYRLAKANQIDDGGVRPNTKVRVDPSGEVTIAVQQNTTDPTTVLRVTNSGDVIIRSGLLFSTDLENESLKWKLQMDTSGEVMYLMKRQPDNSWNTVNSWC